MRSSPVPVLLPALALACVGLTGCANEVVASADATTTSMRALLVVEQTLTADRADETRSHASMWFMRVLDEQAVEPVTRLVTDLVEVPASGLCVNPARNAPQPVPAYLGPVELAFAGQVDVRTGAARVPLAVRAFPDVANVVSGVMYTAPGQADLSLPLGGLLSVFATGAEGLGAWEASTDAPSPPADVRIEGLPLDAPELEAPRGRPLSISWRAGEGTDVIYVDIDPVPGSPSERVRCAMPDTGSGTIASLAIPETSQLQLSIHRVRVSTLRSVAGEVGTAHFDVAVAGRVKVAAP
jgi:hypothetical protein